MDELVARIPILPVLIMKYGVNQGFHNFCIELIKDQLCD